ncbi:hypothetical protein DPMN_059815 [Dreissena polymorpha]|uniref:Uncharacterized protein n=1 Tax=Dreissena polymorpha TaxID=45954 RepID=A0A9D4HFB3_DREPO|nr:hypothetical protein DPMN_059815 [Dreissena polymorpha]
MQEKTNIFVDNSAILSFIINRGKSRMLKPTHPTTHPSQGAANSRKFHLYQQHPGQPCKNC